MIHPHTELKFVNDAIGYGVFAVKAAEITLSSCPSMLSCFTVQAAEKLSGMFFSKDAKVFTTKTKFSLIGHR